MSLGGVKKELLLLLIRTEVDRCARQRSRGGGPGSGDVGAEWSPVPRDVTAQALRSHRLGGTVLQHRPFEQPLNILRPLLLAAVEVRGEKNLVEVKLAAQRYWRGLRV